MYTDVDLKTAFSIIDPVFSCSFQFVLKDVKVTGEIGLPRLSKLPVPFWMLIRSVVVPCAFKVPLTSK